MKSSTHTSRKGSSSTVRKREQSELTKLVDVLRKVQSDTEEAKLNETSMSDNNGGRIKYKGRNANKGKKRTSH